MSTPTLDKDLRSKLVEVLIDVYADLLSDSRETLTDMLESGFTGYDKYTDAEVVTEYHDTWFENKEESDYDETDREFAKVYWTFPLYKDKAPKPTKPKDADLFDDYWANSNSAIYMEHIREGRARDIVIDL